MDISELIQLIKYSYDAERHIDFHEFIDECYETYNKANRTFGMLELIDEQHEKKGKHWKGLYLCECGNEKAINNSSVKSGFTRSCGCIKHNNPWNDFDSLGLSHTAEYRAYYDMRRSCEDENHPKYQTIGNLGHKVCYQWRGKQGFRNFLDDMGLRIGNKQTLSRVDNNIGFSKDNCIWSGYEWNSEKAGSVGFNKYIGVSYDKSAKHWVAQIESRGEIVYKECFCTQRKAVASRDRYIRRHSLDAPINIK